MRNVLVYIAGPISKGDLRSNIQRACDAANELLVVGIPTLVPHLTCFQGLFWVYYDGVRSYYPEVLPRGTTLNQWHDHGLVQVSRCDAVLRLPGESAGADKEVAEAKRLGKPVFNFVAEVIEWVKDLKC